MEEVFICFGTEEFLDIDSDFLQDGDEYSDSDIDAILRTRYRQR